MNVGGEETGLDDLNGAVGETTSNVTDDEREKLSMGDDQMTRISRDESNKKEGEGEEEEDSHVKDSDGEDGDDEEEGDEDDYGGEGDRMAPDVTTRNKVGVIDGNDDDNVDDESNAKSTTTAATTTTAFPLSRVKTIMKLDPEVTLASQEAVALVALATRLFVASVVKDAGQITAQNKKKTIQRRDFDAAVDADPAYAFLEGMIEF